MTVLSDLYGYVEDFGHKYLDPVIGSALDPVLHPHDEVTYTARGVLDNLTGGAFSAWDSAQYMKDYLANTGLDWSDLKYPSKTAGAGAGQYIGATITHLSKNIGKLYR
jgi:hypothetical protein